MGAKVLVTGGAGFVGSNLCAKLLKAGNNDVYCLDNLSTGNFENIVSLRSKNFHFINDDVKDLSLNDKFDIIYNLACPASPIHYQKDPISTVMTSVWGTYNVLELARKTGAKVIQASTSEVYGDPAIQPQTENYFGNVNPTGIRACYDEGKRVAETLCFDYHRVYSIEVLVARIFNTYGPNMAVDDGRVVSNFVVQALTNQPLTINGDGRQTRSFMYIDDLIDGLMALAEKSTRTVSTPINLGNPCEVGVEQLSKMILSLIPESRSGIAYCDLPQDDPTRRKPDIKKANHLLKWEPKITLEVGLSRTINHFRDRLDEKLNA
jgi:UDP-glucuronate decarboxylase